MFDFARQHETAFGVVVRCINSGRIDSARSLRGRSQLVRSGTNQVTESDVRTFSKTLTLMGLLAPVGVNALGVGEIKLNSALNQMLKAEIPLITTGSEANSEIKVNLASPSAFAEAGIERPYFLTRLRFTPVVENGQVVVKVTSRDVIREPFLNFLLEVNWPNGHTLREFTVLLDPPSTFDDETITAIRAPQVESRTVVEPRIPLDRPANATVADKRQEPAKREVPLEKKQKVAQEKKIPDFVRSKRNDTLWALAKRVDKDRSVSHTQMMIALFEANPKAFYRKNINALKAGQRLRIPARQTILRISRRNAIAEYRAQNDQWRTTVSTSGAPDEPSTLTSPVQSADRSESGISTKFELASADSGKSDPKSTGESSSVGKHEIAPEVVDSLRQENTELRKRLKEDEEQLNRLNKLLELKDQQLSALQSSRPAAESVAEKPDESGKTADEKAEPAEPVADRKGLDKPAEDQKLATTTADQSAKGTSADASEFGEKTVAPPETTVVASIEIPAQTKAITDTATANDAASEEHALADGSKTPEPSADADQETATKSVEKSPATTIESAPEVTPPPVTSESTASPQEVERDFVDELLAEPDYLMMGGGIAVVLGLIGWILVRRSRRNLTDDQESFMDSSLTASGADSDKEAGVKTTPGLASENSGMVESSFLSEFTPSDFDAIESDHEEVDPVSEADVYLAYGRYQQAEDLIRNAIETYPERDECKLKLLEIYFVTENRKAFEEYASTLEELKQEKPKIWAKVVEMGRELCPDSALFKPGQVSLQKEPTDNEPVLDLAQGIPPVVDLQKGTSDTTKPASNDDELTFEIDDAFNAENELGDLEPFPESDDALDFDSKLGDDDNAIEFERFGELASADLSSASDELERDSKSGLSDDLKALELASDAEFDQSIDQSIEAEQTTSADSLSEFSDLTDMDEIETKLDLAKAYFDMDDQESARGILSEVLLEGNDEQKSQARALVDMMEHKV